MPDHIHSLIHTLTQHHAHAELCFQRAIDCATAANTRQQRTTECLERSRTRLIATDDLLHSLTEQLNHAGRIRQSPSWFTEPSATTRADT